MRFVSVSACLTASSGPIRKIPTIWCKSVKAATTSGIASPTKSSRNMWKTWTIVKMVLAKDTIVVDLKRFMENAYLSSFPT